MIFNPKTTNELIQAIEAVNASSGFETFTIYLQPGQIYKVTSAYDTYVGLPIIHKSMTIIGNGATLLRDSVAQFKFLLIEPSIAVVIKGVTFRNGQSPAPYDGGAIGNQGALYLIKCKFEDNHTTDDGGAVYNTPGSSAYLTNCVLTNNSGKDGGAIANIGGGLTVTESVIYNNHATNNGGGIYSTGDTYVKGCTFYDNVGDKGGAIDARSTIEITDSEFHDNEATDGSGSSLHGAGSAAKINYCRIFDNADTSVFNLTGGSSIDAQGNWWGTLSGPSGDGPGIGDSVGSNVDYEPWSPTEDCAHEGPTDCQFNFGANDSENGPNPISLRFGEKRAEETDLTINTPAGTLDFTRFYRQDKLDEPAFQFMGLGWTHNHDILLEDPGSSNPITVITPKGGKVIFVFSETVSSIDYYVAEAGSSSIIAVDTGSSDAYYTLTAADQSKFIFDDDKKLRIHLWPTSERWTYHYYGDNGSEGADQDGKLKQILDGYGRALQFTYFRDTESDEYKRRQLWRVGDHTATGLDGGSPAGRYIEFDYTAERVDGDLPLLGDPRALLSSVTDVLGNTWTYDYYGQESGEDITEWLNWMTQRLSPSVDTTGNGTLDGSLILEELLYGTHDIELAVNGDMEADSDWFSVGSPSINEQWEDEFDIGPHSRRVKAETIGDGIEGKPWNLVQGRSYTVSARVYIKPPTSGTVTVKMQGVGTAAFDQSTSISGSWQTLTVTDYVPPVSLDTRLQFVATAIGGDGHTEFYVDSVSIQETNLAITQKRGIQGPEPALLETVYQFAPALNYTAETIVEQLPPKIHSFDRGVYAGTANPAGEANNQTPNNQFRPRVQEDANGNSTGLRWSEDGKQLQGVTDALGHQTSFNYVDDRLESSLDAEGKKTTYIYDAANRQPTLVLVSTSSSEVDVKGDMEDVDDWDSVGTDVINELSLVDSGDYCRRVEADAADEGIESVSWDIISGKEYVVTARVYPVSGVVKMQVTGTSSFDATSTGTGEWETLSATYPAIANASNKKLQFIASSGAAEFYVDSVSVYEDGIELLLDGHMELRDGDLGDPWPSISGYEPVSNQRRPGSVAGLYSRRVKVDSADEGIESPEIPSLSDGDTYILMARVYPVSGSVKMQVSGASSFEALSSTSSVDMRTWQTLRAVYTGTGESGIRIQFLADGGAAEFYVDTVHLLDLTNLLQWQEFRYDYRGRTLEEVSVNCVTAQPIQKTSRSYYLSGVGNGLLQSVTQFGASGVGDAVTTTYTYDEVGRVVKTHQTSLLGSCAFSYMVYDEAGNVLATVCGPQNTTPPATVEDAIALYTGNNEHKVTTHDYDTLGRRVKTTVNAGAEYPIKQASLTVYDALNRVIRTINNYVANLDIPNPYTALHDAFDHGTTNDQNMVTDTAYNARGFVRKQVDVMGKVTLFGYNEAGHLIKTVQNASQPAYNNDYNEVIDLSPDPSMSAYEPSENAAQDVITTQEYDPVGNLVKSVDALGSATFTVYDALNRPVKTVRAAHEGATVTLNPGDVGYEVTHDPRSESYLVSSDPDRDLIETTEYDGMGRVVRTHQLIDNRSGQQWNTTLFGYDELGRQVTVIRSASQPDYNLANDPDLSEYLISAAVDADIVTHTIYDTNGRVLFTEDAMGAKTWLVYDGLGRQVKTIANYVDQGEDPALWVWDNGDQQWEQSGGTAIDHGTANDQNIITLTEYDSDGRVYQTRDVLGRVQRMVYDSRGRVVRTVANYVPQGSSNPFDWEWVTSQWEDGDSTAIDHGDELDENVISSSVYDTQGRALQTIDHRNNATQYVYDPLGRRATTITNYVAQGESDPVDWTWNNNQWEDGDENAISFGADHDQNRITTTTYDLAGRVSASRDAAGVETLFIYDGLGRRVATITNYVAQGTSDPTDWEWSADNQRWEDGDDNAISFGANNDQNQISTVTYNRSGQVILTRDARGTQTAFTYDQAGRRLTMVQAANSPLSSTSYTCYDKVGRVLRTIQNWIDDGLSPDAQMGGIWEFEPGDNGPLNDRNLVTGYTYDQLGRRTRAIDPMGNETQTTYFKDGQVRSVIDAENVATQYRYDGLRRRSRVVQAYEPVSQIAFYSDRDSNTEIYTMNADGTEQVNRSDAADGDQDPTWSPDGGHIAFVSTRDGGVSGYQDLYRMKADGTNPQRLTDLSGFVVTPSWSPDGSKIAFSLKTGGGLYNQLYVVHADGSNLQLIHVEESQEVAHPSWSPDGQRIVAYIGPNSSQNDIYIIRADGTELVNLTDESADNNTFPSWSPDGSKIAFQSRRTGNWDVFIMDADGTNQVNLTAGSSADNFYPAWSPDGSQLVFYSTRDGDREIYVMDIDGSNVVQLTDNSDQDRYPQWAFIDPLNWIWSVANARWEDGLAHELPHGTNNDRNIIVEVTYDIAGRVITQRNPLGIVAQYAYDQLNRRIQQTNNYVDGDFDLDFPDEDIIRSTTYTDLPNGQTQTVLTDPNEVVTQRTFDRLGRLVSITYGDPENTPDVKFTYDSSGNRSQLSEYTGADFSDLVRETTFDYDDVHRLVSVDFDHADEVIPDETVSYEYDVGGLRTKLTLPGDVDVIYNYNLKGQLVSLTDWDAQQSRFAYDLAGRHIATERSNELRSRYRYDAAGRLRLLRHTKDFKTLGHFEYQVDKRGNRTQVLEALPDNDSGTTTIAHDDVSITYQGTWTEVDGYHESSEFSASMSFLFFGQEDVTLKIGEGPDHSSFDIYVGGSLWESIDGYAESAGERTVTIPLQGEGPHRFEIRNRAEKNLLSTAYKVRFKSLAVDNLYHLHTIRYQYDFLSRLLSADYYPGQNTAATPFRTYEYGYDVAGNRRAQIVNGGTPTSFNYNAINQLTNDGTNDYTYDTNGNLLSDGTNSYTWDRANRLLSMSNLSYQYDGMGNRVQQKTGDLATRYLLDLQPGLAVILRAQEWDETDPGDPLLTVTTNFVHSLRGIHAQETMSGWEWTVQDGLGSVRGVVDNGVGVLESRTYDPYGQLFYATSTDQTPYGFTGEPTDSNGLLYLRARYYNPAAGVFTALDPFEGMVSRPMSLNGYSWVEGNTPNMVDPSGMICDFGRSAENVVSECGLGCTTFWAGINSPSLEIFKACNPTIRTLQEAAATLLVSLRECGCETFRLYNVHSRSDQQFFALHTNLLNRKDRLLNFVARAQCGNSILDSLYTDMIDYIDPATCYQTYDAPTPSNPRVLTIGGRLIDFTLVLGAAFDANLELHCAPYYLFGGGERCAWFFNLAGGANTNLVGVSVGAGVVVGVLGWPTQPGATSFVNSAGFGISSPWLQLGGGGDFTWDPNSGDMIFFLGISGGLSPNPSPIQGYLMTGASVYLGPDINNLPVETGAAIIAAVEYLLGQGA